MSAPRIHGTDRKPGSGTVRRRANGSFEARSPRGKGDQGGYVGNFESRREAEAALTRWLKENGR